MHAKKIGMIIKYSLEAYVLFIMLCFVNSLTAMISTNTAHSVPDLPVCARSQFEKLKSLFEKHNACPTSHYPDRIFQSSDDKGMDQKVAIKNSALFMDIQNFFKNSLLSSESLVRILNTCIDQKTTFLNWAIEKNAYDVIDLLLQKGSNPNNILDHTILPSTTPVYNPLFSVIAIAPHNITFADRVTKRLIDARADCNAKDNKSQSVMQQALKIVIDNEQDVRIPQRLIQGKADVSRSAYPNASLIENMNNNTLVELLLTSNAHPDAATDDSKTSPLFYAIKKGNLEQVSSLIEHNAQVTIQSVQMAFNSAVDSNGDTSKHIDILKVVWEKTSDENKEKIIHNSFNRSYKLITLSAKLITFVKDNSSDNVLTVFNNCKANNPYINIQDVSVVSKNRRATNQSQISLEDASHKLHKEKKYTESTLIKSESKPRSTSEVESVVSDFDTASQTESVLLKGFFNCIFNFFRTPNTALHWYDPRRIVNWISSFIFNRG